MSISDKSDINEVLEIVHESTSAWVCVTLGERGVRYRSPEGFGTAVSEPVDAVETLGAGDVWHGAFALKLAEGNSEIKSMAYANQAASLKCTRSGGRASYPYSHELEK